MRKKYSWEKDKKVVAHDGSTGAAPTGVKPNYSGETQETTEKTPGFVFSQQEEYDKAKDAYLNSTFDYRDFQYNLEADPFYQQLTQRYQNQAQAGMEDAMARAAAMTGGYGNSYAQQVGQQAYYNQMNELDDVAIGLYQNAYNMWRDNKGDAYALWKDSKQDAYNKMQMLSGDKETEYAQYLIDNGIINAQEDGADINRDWAMGLGAKLFAMEGDERIKFLTDQGYTQDEIDAIIARLINEYGLSIQ